MFKHIFLALDDSAGAHRALEEALRLAVSMQAAVTAVCVVVHAARLVDVDAGFPDAEPDLPPGVELATAVLAEARARFAAAGVAGEVRAVDAYGEEVAAVLLRTAAESEADLIVMGTHGLHGWRRLLVGSVAESLLRGADRPVLMLHADERAAFAADAVAARAGRQPERRA